MTTTTTNVHGHEIIQLIHLADPPFTRVALHAEVARRWGQHARFYTCSAEGMTLDELLTFLMDRSKVVEHNGSLIPDMSKVCNHDHDSHAG